MTLRIGGIAALCGAVCVFVGGMAAFPLHLIGDLMVSTPLSVATGVGIWYFWPGRKPANDIETLLNDQELLKNATGLSKRDIVETIRLVSDKLDRILMSAAQINEPKVTRRIQHLDAIGRKIIDEFRVRPIGIQRSQTWIHAYLDQAIECVDQYAQLHGSKIRNDEVRRQMVEFDDMLVELQEKSQELLDLLLTHDTTTFDVNVSVFRDMMKNEGI